MSIKGQAFGTVLLAAITAYLWSLGKDSIGPCAGPGVMFLLLALPLAGWTIGATLTLAFKLVSQARKAA